MKKLFVLAAVAALAACGEKAEETPMAEDTTAAAPEAAPTAMTAADAAGTYDVKNADGTMSKVTINADGTYTSVDGKGVEETGMWSSKDNGSCFDPEGDAPAICWTDGKPDANGVFTATTVDGKTTVTVTPQAKPAAAAPAPAAT